MISLSNRLQQYLVIRRRCGHDLTASARELRPFVTFADAEGAAWITVDLFLRWKERFGLYISAQITLDTHGHFAVKC